MYNNEFWKTITNERSILDLDKAQELNRQNPTKIKGRGNILDEAEQKDNKKVIQRLEGQIKNSKPESNQPYENLLNHSHDKPAQWQVHDNKFCRET